MNIVVVQTLFTYITALVTIIGGGIMLYLLRTDTSGLNIVIAGFIGASLSYTYNREVSAATARDAAHQTAVTAANGKALSNGTSN